MVPEANPAFAQPSVLTTIPDITTAVDVAYDPVHERMYVTSGPSGDVYVIDVNTNTQVDDSPISIGGRTDRIAYDPEHRTMYVTDRANNNVRVINTDDITETPVTINIGGRSQGVAYNPDNEMMYVVDFPGSGVIIIDTNTNPPSIAGTVSPLSPGFGASFGIAYDSDHQRMYVARDSPTLPGAVDIIDTSVTPNVLDNINGPITVGKLPQFGIAYDPVHQTMYVANFGDVSVIDTNFVNPTVTIPAIGPGSYEGIAYDPVNLQMYVADATTPNSKVDVIDTNTNTLVPPPIPVGDAARGIAYEPINGRMYVANSGSNDVTVIQTPGFGGTATANIDSATDGDGSNVENGGTTTSPDITFAFSGTGATSFECSIDYSTFEACTSGQTYTGLDLGEHTFDVRALDNNGDRQAPPTRFTWTVQEAVDPVTAIQDLITDIADIDDGVPNGVQQSLIAQLNIALRFISDDNTANDHISCTKLDTFTNKVSDFENEGLLTEEQADDLRQQAQTIRDAIGCSFLSSSQAAAAADIASSTNVDYIPSPALSLPR